MQSGNDEPTDLVSFKQQQSNRRCNLPNFLGDTVAKKVSTDEDLQGDGYIRYLKQPEEDATTRDAATRKVCSIYSLKNINTL